MGMGRKSHENFTKIVQGAPPGDIEGVVFFSPVFCFPFFGGKSGGWWGMVGMVILKIWIGDGDSECGGLVILKIWIGGSWFFLGLIF